jgi:hypothetical protein
MQNCSKWFDCSKSRSSRRLCACMCRRTKCKGTRHWSQRGRGPHARPVCARAGRQGSPMRPMRMHTQRGPVRPVRTGAAVAVAHSAAVGKDLEGFEAVHVQQVQHAAASSAAYAPRHCGRVAPRTHPPAVLVHALCTHPAGIWRGRARASGKGREGTGRDGCVPGLCWRRIAKSELLGCHEFEGQLLKPERNTLCAGTGMAVLAQSVRARAIRKGQSTPASQGRRPNAAPRAISAAHNPPRPHCANDRFRCCVRECKALRVCRQLLTAVS